VDAEKKVSVPTPLKGQGKWGSTGKATTVPDAEWKWDHSEREGKKGVAAGADKAGTAL